MAAADKYIGGAYHVRRRESCQITDLLGHGPHPRGRRGRSARRLLETFRETASDALTSCSSSIRDDQDTYAGMDWETASAAVAELAPREYLAGKLNKTALAMTDLYKVLMWAGDDVAFRTPAWDKIMLAALDDLGGSGWIYPDDKRRSDVPEHWMVSSDVVKALGWFANPMLDHFYLDNSIAELGKRAGLIRWCPQAVVEHLHYSVCAETEHDALYQSTEEKFGESDLKAFHEWRSSQLANEVSVLRREFSADVKWVLSRVG